MASYNGNGAYLSIDGVNVSGFYTTFTPSRSMDGVDITAGAGTNHRQRAEGLEDGSCSGPVVYDSTAVSTEMAKLDVGEHVIIYGPEGQSTGKPKHECRYIITSLDGPTVDVEKAKVVFEFSGDAADAPTVNMYTGGVFS